MVKLCNEEYNFMCTDNGRFPNTLIIIAMIRRNKNPFHVVSNVYRATICPSQLLNLNKISQELRFGQS